MMRRPTRSTLSSSSAASDVYKRQEIIERYFFFTRYLFSCLTDADFIDTERFVTPNTDRGIDGDFQKAYEKVCEKLNSFKIETKLQESRSIIQEQVYKSVESNANVYTCLLYTSDAADEEDSVDLGRRRNIKKKKKKPQKELRNMKTTVQ